MNGNDVAREVAAKGEGLYVVDAEKNVLPVAPEVMKAMLEEGLQDVEVTEENDDRYRTVSGKFENPELYVLQFDATLWDVDIISMRSGKINLHLRPEWRKK